MKRLKDIGERNAVQKALSILSTGQAVHGIGDDCAIIEYGEQYLLVTTDMITQKTHIPKQMTAYQIGWFSTAINLSDIAAKGGTPLGVLLSLGLPKNMQVRFFEDLMKGAHACAKCYSTSIVGGDTKEHETITVCGTAVGTIQKDMLMSRKGARPGDVVAVTGTLGKAGAGYLALHHHMKNRRIIAGLLEPVPRIAEGKRLAQEKIVTSCMDLSDGLSSSLYQLMEMNHVGFTIQRDCIPVSPLLSHVTKQNRELWNSVLHFGGDYELLLTLPTDLVHRAVHCLQKIGTPLTMIGKVTKSQDIVLVSGTQHKILPDKGYEHFQKHIF